jgi:UDP-N-acetylglucosamine 2-epimerase
MTGGAGKRTLPIYVLIGTKAQYIKTAPLLRLMQDRGVDYVLIDSGQHADFSKGLRRELEVKEPDVMLANAGNIKSILAAAIWFARQCLACALGRRYLERKVFTRGRGICVLHGDTPSTLVGLMLAKRAGLQVVHIEAGLRSYNILKPFPEELIRVICMRFSDLLFTPSDWALENTRKMGVKGKVVNVRQNTNVEAMYFSLQRAPYDAPAEPFALMTIHRVETILNKSRLTRVVHLARQIAERLKVVFVLHDPTAVKLNQYGLMGALTENPRIETTGLVDHKRFLRLIEAADFVVTDGGSIQEECHYLDVPCLVMRSETERQDGIGSNVVISGFDDAKIAAFLEGYRALRRGHRVENLAPSQTILDIMLTGLGSQVCRARRLQLRDGP